MILPYRTKNPPERFPFVTLFLIAINILIYALTTENMLVIRDSVMTSYAVSHNTFSFSRVLTAMFLHANLLHILGNMWFLWIFGPSVEGRLRPLKYALMYLAAGFAGDLLHEAVMGVAHPDEFSLGASGAIMGVAGAYLFLFPYSTICVLVGAQVRFGTLEMQARWVVLIYVGLDLLEGVISRGADGVGHFAHLGGAAAGVLIPLLLRTRRDGRDISTVQATRSEVRDYELLSLDELEVLMRQPVEDPQLVLVYCQKALGQYGGSRADLCLAAIRKHAGLLLERGDLNMLGWLLLSIPPAAGAMPPVFYLRLASRLEAIYSNEYAAGLYRRVYELDPNAPDTETALYRLARLLETAFQNPAQAQAVYAELLQRFPYGNMAHEARRALGVRA